MTVRTASISGKVLDEGGKPVAAKILVYRWFVRSGASNPAAICSTSTDAQGSYACTRLAAGKYVVSAYPADADPLSAEQGRAAYPLIFYPGVPDMETAVKVGLREAEAAWADFTFHAVHAGPLTVSIASRPASPVLALTADAGAFGLAVPYTLRYDASTGKATVTGLPDGRYRIIANWFAAGADHRASALVEAGSSPSSRDLVLTEDFDEGIRGQLRPTGNPAPKLPVSVTLVSCGMHRRQYASQVEADGSFDFPAVEAGEYNLLMTGADGLFPLSISIGGREVQRRRIAVISGQPVGALDVEVGRSYASIAGVVGMSKPIAGKTGVVLQSLESGCESVAFVDSSGRFHENGIAPGEYRLFAWDDLDDVEYKDARLLRQFAKQSTLVSVAADSSITGLEVAAIHVVD